MMIRKLTFALLASLAFASVACGSSGGDDDGDLSLVDEGALSNAERQGGRFETFRGIDGQRYFRLVAANGLKLVRSEAYTDTRNAESAMDSLMKAAKENRASRFVVLPAADGGYYVNVLGAGSSREVIATSEVYSSRAKATDAVKVIQGYLKGIARVAYEPAREGKRFQLFELEEGGAQPFKFLVRAENGETVLMSEWYETKQAALKGVDSVRENGRRIDNFKVSEIDEGRAVFSLKAANNAAIGFSEVYASRSNATRASEAVRDLLQADLDVEDLTLDGRRNP